VYALGATLYELLIGEPPFHELSPSQVIQRKCELNLPGPSIAGKRRDFPPGLAELVDDCLCPRPGDRVRSMAAFLQRLDGLRDGAGITRNRASENTAMVGVARTVDGAAKKHRLGEIVAEAARAKAAGEPPPPELTPIRTGATRPEIAADRIALHARGATVPAPSAGARGRTELAPAATTHARTELAPAAVADEPPRRRAAVLAVVGAVAIVGGGLAAWWIVSQRPSEPELAPIATHAGSAEATPQPEPPPEPAPTADPETADPTTSIAPLAIAVGSTGDAPEPAEVDTGAVEPDPAPAVAPRPPSNDSGSATPQPRDKPRPPADPWTPERCREERQAAQEALTSGRYAGALSHSRIRKCWPDATERQKIRVQAFFELSRYADCIDAGSSSSDPTIQRTVRRCTKARDAAD
jgi:hypothetical protein